MDGSVRAIPAPFPYEYAEGFAIDYNGGLWIWDEVNSTWKNITGGGPGAYEPIIPFGTAAQYWTGQKLWADLVTTVVPEGTNKYYTSARALADVTWGTITGKPATFPPDAEGVDDRVAALLTAGTNITLVYDDAGNKLTINSTASGGTGTVTAVTGTAPVVSSGGTTPAISMPAATTSISGHLTAADWNTFNGKQAFIVAGTTSQYYRGDKTWATLDKNAVGLQNVLNVAQEPAIAAGTTAQYWRGDKTWQPLPAQDWSTITNKPATFPIDLAANYVWTGTHQFSNVVGMGIAATAGWPLLVHGETNGNLGITGHSTQVGVQLRALNDALSSNAFFEFQATDYQFLTGPVSVKNTNASAGATSGALVVTGDIATGNKVNALRLNVRGTTSGDATIMAQGAVTSYNFNLPLTAGTAGQVLTSQGGGTTSMTWTTPAAPVDAYTKAQSDARYEPIIVPGTVGQYWRGDKSWQPINWITDAPSDGKTYGRKDATWVEAAGGGASVLVGDVPPVGASDKALWWESDTGGFYFLYNDGNSTQWVQLNAKGMQDAPLDSVVYARQNGVWVDAAASIDMSSQYLPLTGGTLSGLVTFNEFVYFNKRLNVNSEASNAYAMQANSNYVALGGVCAFGGNGSTYTIAGYGGYGIYVSGTSSFTQLTCTTCVFNVATTTSAATAYLSSGGGLYRSTSQGMFKQEVEDLEPEYADKVLSLRTIFYRPNELTVDPMDWSRFGFLTEDAYEKDFRFTSCSPAPKMDADGKPIPIMMELMLPDEDGELVSTMVPSGEYEMSGHSPPSDVDLKAIVACLLDVVRRQGERITALETANAV